MKNSAWSVLEVLVYPATLLIATPFFINRLGADYYGVWMLVNSIIASIGVLNIGLGDATIKFVSKYRALGQVEEIRRVVQTNYSVYLGLALLVIILGSTYAYLFDYFVWFEMTDTFRELATYVIPLGSATLGLRFLEQIFLSVFRGFERYDKAARLSIISKLAVLSVQVVIVLQGMSLIEVFAGTACVSLLMVFVEAILVSRFQSFPLFRPRFYRDTFKEVFGFGLWSWLQSIFVIIAAQVDKFMVVALADVQTLSYYSLGYMVYAQLHAVFAAGCSWLFPLISGKLEKQEAVSHIYHRARLGLLVIALSVLLVLFLLKDLIFPTWLGDETYALAGPFILGFVAYEALIVMSIVPYYFLNGAGQARLNTFLEMGLKTLNVVGMVVCCYFWGVMGLIYGLMASLLIFLPVQNYVIDRIIFKQRANWRIIGSVIPSALMLCIFLLDLHPIKYLGILLVGLFIKLAYLDPLTRSNVGQPADQ